VKSTIPGKLDLNALDALCGRDQSPPKGICINCFRNYRATKPQPEVVYCHHNRVAARQMLGDWVTVENVDRASVMALRRELEARR
jgi:hypothetical protein